MSKFTVIGMGMMGGSFALALKRAGLAQSVTGVDLDPGVLNTALQQGIIDRAASKICEGIEEANTVVLATPVSVVMQLLCELARVGYSGLIIDLGSTKQAICETARQFPQLRFVGCHPMAGSEVAGIKGANAALFDGAPVIITPLDRENSALLDRVIELWEKLGCRITMMEPAEHDYSVAIVSHLPYLAAVATMNAAAELAQEKPNIFTLIAGGFRDTTRVSEGDPVMWRDICLTNRTHILKAIEKLRQVLDDLEHALTAQDGSRLQNIFQLSQTRRRTYIAKKK